MRDCHLHLRLVPGCLTRPTGDLGLQLSQSVDDVETWSPPYVGLIAARERGRGRKPRPRPTSATEDLVHRPVTRSPLPQHRSRSPKPPPGDLYGVGRRSGFQLVSLRRLLRLVLFGGDVALALRGSEGPIWARPRMRPFVRAIDYMNRVLFLLRREKAAPRDRNNRRRARSGAALLSAPRHARHYRLRWRRTCGSVSSAVCGRGGQKH